MLIHSSEYLIHSPEYLIHSSKDYIHSSEIYLHSSDRHQKTYIIVWKNQIYIGITMHDFHLFWEATQIHVKIKVERNRNRWFLEKNRNGDGNMRPTTKCRSTMTINKRRTNSRNQQIEQCNNINTFIFIFVTSSSSSHPHLTHGRKTKSIINGNMISNSINIIGPIIILTNSIHGHE